MSETTTSSSTGTLAGVGLHAAPIGQIAIRVHDAERAERFYRDQLGLRHLFSFLPKMAFFDAGGVRLMLSTAENAADDHPASVLYFKVPDLRATRAELLARGVSFIDEPHLIARMPDHELWMTFFRDSEENVKKLTTELGPPIDAWSRDLSMIAVGRDARAP